MSAQPPKTPAVTGAGARSDGGPSGSPYLQAAYAAMPRLVSLLDRDPLSRSYGSFDRDHWAWKFRDFPLTMLQLSAVPLATAWRHGGTGNIWYRNDAVHAWLLAALGNLCARQHRNGAFDSVGPFTQDHGVTLASAWVLTESVRLLGDSVPASLHRRIIDTVGAACRFALRSEEDYAYVSNHRALFALAWQGAGVLLDDRELTDRAESVIRDIIGHQSADGWYPEYGGPDPGYESLGLAYLAKYWQRSPSEALLGSLTRSIEFFAHCVHPDGSIGGAYGSRLTRLWFPSGFEILAPHVREASAVAAFMRGRLDRDNVVTLANVDVHNLAPLIASYLDAGRDAAELADPPPVPATSLQGVRVFEAAALCAAGTQRYYALFSARAGGVLCVFDRRSGRLACEDAGYAVRRDGRWYASHGAGTGRALPGPGGQEFACEVPLFEMRQETLTPARFLLLRALNLTLFRSLRLGAWIRGLIVGRLVTARRGGPFRLRRAVEFDDTVIRVRDLLTATTPGPVETVSRIRGSPALHMGSARYHHGSDLEPMPAVESRDMAGPLASTGEAGCAFVIRFDDEAPVTVERAEPVQDWQD